jgi:tryptophanyl-tRNA synthetase
MRKTQRKKTYLEEESEHVVSDLLAVGFSPTDGTTLVQVLWDDGTNTWELLSTMQLQEDFQERIYIGTLERSRCR